MSKNSSEDASEAANSITISGSILQRLEHGKKIYVTRQKSFIIKHVLF